MTDKTLIFNQKKAIALFIIPLFFNLLVMRRVLGTALLLFVISFVSFAQKGKQGQSAQYNPDNIYSIKQQFLYNILHNPAEKEENHENDNELTRFNRWFSYMEPRCYPTGNMPRPDVILKATDEAYRTAKKSGHKTTATPAWTPVGPMKVPSNANGIGRVNCVIIDPIDTNTLYVGAACGGVFISHNGGTTWASNSDNFPSLSIADIAVDPLHTDTIYAATGDGYGYETGGFNIFWGGLYSAGVMKSTDGGSTWNTTGLSYLQTNREIIQRLLIHPTKTNILLAATRNGTKRTTDGGATWTTVDGGHIYSMAFRPGRPDTVYAINNTDLRVSYNAGATWQTLKAGLNPTGSRCTIGVSPVTPNAIWVLDANEDVKWSHNGGGTFFTTNPPDTAAFYGYYDRVFAVSPADSNYLIAGGLRMTVSANGGAAWVRLNPTNDVHADIHALTFNPLHPATIYSGNDGGISVTRNGGATWKNLGDGLMISQIYRMGCSQQDSNIIICGLQDNGTIVYDGTNWRRKTGGDGEACAIHPTNDYLQIASWQYGHFYQSFDRGVNFASLDITTESGSWTAPVVFDPNNEPYIYFGYRNIFGTRDGGSSFINLTNNTPFANGATQMAIGQSNSNVIYASDLSKIIRSTDAGNTWTIVTGNLPTTTVAITRIAVDPRDPMVVYVTTSGYVAGSKLFMSTTGGTTWTNISSNLPNIPANCIAIDTSTPGALFVGTDIGIYYTDSSATGFSLYGTGHPNVMVFDLNVNYGNYKIRTATFGRGVWECPLKKAKPVPVVDNSVRTVGATHNMLVQAYPNPAKNNWKLIFHEGKPAKYLVKVSDVSGRLVLSAENTDQVNATNLAAGVYTIEVIAGDEHHTIKAVKE
jgi:photosystem II stability/assembly factor-like uncharacterized protein